MNISDNSILKMFNAKPKKGGYTPAELSKKYDLNKYRKILQDPNSDKMDRKTAEMMIKNYTMKLGALALAQESKKGFPQGIPELAKPYMESNGISEEDLLPQKPQPQQQMPQQEMMDAPDFILEQLKDILSSGVFRNGTQVFPIKTKFIVCCTNRTRDEFSKNMSLKALMERFPLELNVIWDNYTEIAYNKLLETKFGEGNVDPVIPFLLQEYHAAGITISPRVAVIAYQIFSECGPDALTFLAEFAKKPEIIKDALKKYENTISFRVLSAELGELVTSLQSNKLSNSGDIGCFDKEMKVFAKKMRELKALKVTDELVATHTDLVKGLTELYTTLDKKSKVSSIME
jgi:hypothetical protein